MKTARPLDFLACPPPRSPRIRQAGFHLLGFSVLLCALGLAAVVAGPRLQQAQQTERSAAVARDLKTFAAGINGYAHDRGDWPAAALLPGEPPIGVDKFFFAADWLRPTPIGGRYTWAPNSRHQGERYRAVIVIASLGPNQVTTARKQLEEIDHLLDDGDLQTGKFRLGYRNYPMWVIEH